MEKNVLRALKACILFENLTDDEIVRYMIGVDHIFMKYPKKAIYAVCGQPIEYIAIVISGEMIAKMERTPNKCVTLATYFTGRLLASTVIFSQTGNWQVTVEASKPTTLLRMTPEALLTLTSRDRRIQMNYIRLLSSICYQLVDRVRIITLHTIREKVAILLLEEAKRRNSRRLKLNLSRQEIADSFAIQKHSLQRCLGEFTKEGIITLQAKTVEILDMQKLILLAGL